MECKWQARREKGRTRSLSSCLAKLRVKRRQQSRISLVKASSAISPRWLITVQQLRVLRSNFCSLVPQISSSSASEELRPPLHQNPHLYISHASSTRHFVHIGRAPVEGRYHAKCSRAWIGEYNTTLHCAKMINSTVACL